MDALSTQGAVATDELVDAADAGEVMAKRRLEDEAFAAFAEASIVFLDLPDAVFRGYADDEELLNAPRENDAAPYEILRREIVRLEPQKLYLPLGVGNHVDHQLCRDVGVRLLAEGRRWVMPGPDYAGIVTFYEDFPYAWWNDFAHISDLPPTAFADLPDGIALTPEYADIADQIERKITAINLYDSQIDRLFEGTQEMARQVRAYGRKVALLNGWGGVAERYWSTGRA
jgi:LmbE family N-acetylglucosaminyl deacetylase